MENRPDTKPIGIFMSLDKILEKVDKIDEDINGRLHKLEIQIATMWVTHGIMIACIIAGVTTIFTQRMN